VTDDHYHAFRDECDDECDALAELLYESMEREKVLEEACDRADARARDLEEAQGELLDANDRLWMQNRALCPVAGAPDAQDMAVYVAWLYGGGLTPAQAGEEDEFCDEAPNPCETCDHRFHLVKSKRMGTCVRCGDSWPVWGDY